MKITSQQQEVLNSLRCERLSSDVDNLYAVDCFENYKNDTLSFSLKNEAYEEDESSSTAYYLIKNPQNDILFYFSLKCGSLFTELDDEKLKISLKLQKCISEILNNKDADSSELEIANLIREQFRIRKNISKNDLDKYIRNYGSIFDDFFMESENSISRVGFTYSGIELVHFCANDAKCDYLRQVFKDATLGGVIFWHFIVDIILRVRKLIGCQYLFLFAADLTPDEHLVNYYKEKLKFEVPSDLGVNKPFYDFTCKFMCQKIETLENHRENFFANFNKEEDAV